VQSSKICPDNGTVGRANEVITELGRFGRFQAQPAKVYFNFSLQIFGQPFSATERQHF
jgi:hypothetical protein